MSAIDLGPRYEFIRELGSGGMARVLLVRDLHLRRNVAFKLFRQAPVTEEELEEVKREFALLAELEHPGIARAHDFGYFEGRPFFTSEFIDGEPLSARRAVTDERSLLRIAHDLAEAIAFLHRGGILHLDIKASNIILSRMPGRERAVLIDFGLFRRGIPGSPGNRIRGSLPYMSPEYFRGGRLGPWTDVYALGVTLFRVATGVFPRAGATEEGGGLDDEAAWDPVPRDPSELCPFCPADLGKVILKCIALEPHARFPSGEHLLGAIERMKGAQASKRGQGLALPATLGRELELDEAERWLEGLLEHHGGPATLLITGPPGVGQSHFLRMLKIRAQTRGFRFYLETGYPGAAPTPGSLLRALGAHITSVSGTADVARSRARWEEFLQRLRTPRRPSKGDITEGERRLRRASEIALAARCVDEPLVIAADGLQHFDEVSIALIADLVRFLGETPGPARPPLGLALGLREEGTSAPLLREIVEHVLQPCKGTTVTLRPLVLKDTLALFHERGGQETDEDRGLSLLQRTGGLPARIVALAPALPSREDTGPRGHHRPDVVTTGRGRMGRAGLDALGSAGSRGLAQRLLMALVLLDRPAGALELRGIVGAPRASVHRAMAALGGAHLASRASEESGGQEWIPTPRARALAEALSPIARRRMHRKIAEQLARRARGDGGDDGGETGHLVETVRHFRSAGLREPVVRFGLAAASSLKARFQHRAALQVLRNVLDALPRRDRRTRLDVALEIADLHARIGDTDVEEAIRILREILPQARALPGSAAARVILRLATLHGRRGDFRRAETLFNEGLREADEADARLRGPRLRREERLLFTNEHAAMKAAVGDYAEALALCDKGFRLAGHSRDPEIREVVLNLHATRANVALRNYDYEGATHDLQKAAEIAEAISSPGNQATVLNNLGVVLGQCDRYEEAIRAFGEAQRICLRLDEGPSLASIAGNLAILHAKVGDFAAADAALAWGEKLVPGIMGRRQEFFLRHARGVSLLSRGRYAEGRAAMEAAIRLGTEIGDRHVVTFDEVYRAEALVFEGAHGEARHELERLSRSEFPERIRRMALARRALVEALLGRSGEARAIATSHSTIATRPVPYLDAWDDLFLGWAVSVGGGKDESFARLAPAESFFRSRALGPALSLLLWVKAEACFLAGDIEGAWAYLGDAMPPGHALGAPMRARGAAVGASPEPGRRLPDNDLTAALRPLLAARLVLEGRSGREARARAADLLAEAGAALVANPLPEWSARLEVMRAALSTGGRPRVVARRLRRDLAAGLTDALRRPFLSNPSWARWTDVAAAGSRGHPGGSEAPTAPKEGSTTTRTMTGDGKRSEAGASRSRERIVARSSGMRRLLSLLDKLRSSELPVLVHGETGSGKEMIARTLHDESRRRDGPFEVVDCAAIPAALLESELFGARAGAYTGIETDRTGILELARGGTALLDEVAGLSLEMQAKLLRVLAEGTVRPLGAEKERGIDVRFLFSTSRDLEAEVEAGRFRRDLLHRIRVVTLDVPPLRERPEDVRDLVDVILAELGGSRPEVDAGVIERLRAMVWPGNVRELRNLLSRLSLESPGRITREAVERARGDPHTVTLFPRNLLTTADLTELQRRLERDYIVYHFRRLGYDTEAICKFLHRGRRQFYRRCARLGIVLRDLREGN